MSLLIALTIVLGITVLLTLLHLKLKLSLRFVPYALTAASVIAQIAFLLRKMGYDFGVIEGRDPVMLLFYALFAIGLCSQLLSFLFLRYFVYPSKECSEPFFMVLYTLWLSLGMVTVELLLQPTGEDFLLPLLKVAGHLTLAAVFGYFIGMAKFAESPEQNFTYLNSGLGAAIIVQGLQEYFILEHNYPNLIILILGTGFIAMGLVAYLLRQKLQDKKEISPQELLEELNPEDRD